MSMLLFIQQPDFSCFMTAAVSSCRVLHKGLPTHCPFLRCERLHLVTPPVRCLPHLPSYSAWALTDPGNQLIASLRLLARPAHRRSFALLAFCFRCETHTFVVQSGINKLAFARARLLTSNLLFHARSPSAKVTLPWHKQPVSLGTTPCLVSLFHPQCRETPAKNLCLCQQPWLFGAPSSFCFFLFHL